MICFLVALILENMLLDAYTSIVLGVLALRYFTSNLCTYLSLLQERCEGGIGRLPRVFCREVGGMI